jgi:hypothetical protein
VARHPPNYRMASISGRVSTDTIARLRHNRNARDDDMSDGGRGVSKIPHGVARSAAVADEHDECHCHERRGGEER